ncbi:MAG TPA: hypothetical protein PLA68_09600 [Panacibacter sp.]|nr:hypothetical protein [Panacibacter sp.]
MQLQQAIKNVFVQLSDTLEQLSEEQYKQPSKILFNATIGQHTRHIIELFMELDNGYETGIVNYEKRKRDYLMETDKTFAASLLHRIYTGLNKQDKELVLESNYDEQSDEVIAIKSNYRREVVYNLEHTVHHMALIRAGITELSNIDLPQDFGVASSTIKYRKAVAQ